MLEGLSKLEYRGYDSAGLAVRDGDAAIEVVKAKGRLSVLAEKTNSGQAMAGTCGTGSTQSLTPGFLSLSPSGEPVGPTEAAGYF